MRRSVAIAFIASGLAVLALGRLALPPGDGRLQFLIEVVDPRPPAEAVTPEPLAAMGAKRAVVMENPDGTAAPRQLLLVAGLAGVLQLSDCALGALPGRGGGDGLAGFESGLDRGALALGGRQVAVCGTLQPLGPLFDESLVVPWSEGTERELRAAGWKAEVRHLLFPASWRERNRLIGKLESDRDALPAAGATVIAHGRRPPLSRRGVVAIAAGLTAGGLLVLALCARGLSREEIARRLGRGPG